MWSIFRLLIFLPLLPVAGRGSQGVGRGLARSNTFHYKTARFQHIAITLRS
jgi:hypothetical protein